MSAAILNSPAILTALREHALPVLRRIEVEESDSTVILRGTVPLYYHKQLAQEAVMPLLQGRALENRIQVRRVVHSVNAEEADSP